MAREEACKAVLVVAEQCPMSFGGGGSPPNTARTTQHSAKRLVAHLGTQRIRSSGDEFEPSSAPTVGAFCSNGFIVEYLVLIRFQPHELETLWTGPDLR
jgi:hypothetical protein